jgi:hypothetical protein
MLIPRLIILHVARKFKRIAKFINQHNEYDNKVYKTE